MLCLREYLKWNNLCLFVLIQCIFPPYNLNKDTNKDVEWVAIPFSRGSKDTNNLFSQK